LKKLHDGACQWKKLQYGKKKSPRHTECVVNEEL